MEKWAVFGIVLVILAFLLGWFLSPQGFDVKQLQEQNMQLQAQINELNEKISELENLDNGVVPEPLEPNEDVECVTNSDCVLKQAYYCCNGESFEVDSCFGIDEEPRVPDCSGTVGVCPGVVGVKNCVCLNRECVADYIAEY